MKENKIRKRNCKNGVWEHKRMADCNGYAIFKTIEKRVGEIDKIWFEIRCISKTKLNPNLKFETLKEVRDYAKRG